jgi:hypothetical protein
MQARQRQDQRCCSQHGMAHWNGRAPPPGAGRAVWSSLGAVRRAIAKRLACTADAVSTPHADQEAVRTLVVASFRQTVELGGDLRSRCDGAGSLQPITATCTDDLTLELFARLATVPVDTSVLETHALRHARTTLRPGVRSAAPVYAPHLVVDTFLCATVIDGPRVPAVLGRNRRWASSMRSTCGNSDEHEPPKVQFHDILCVEFIVRQNLP